MSWRIQGLSNSFKKAASAAANRKIGQLVHITDVGAATTIADGNLAFPLIQDFDYLNDQVAEAQISGVGKVYVEATSGIEAGVPLTVGATGVGVKQAAVGDVILGIALAKPSGNGDLIPYLISVYPKADNIY